MANYSLVINSAFKPFSYQEMLAPILQATQAHQAVEEAYGELNQKASIWDGLANEQTDPNAYRMYKKYSEDLQQQADQLAKEGLNTNSRKDMLNMRSRYSKEITPIEQAYAARQKQAEQQQQALLQDPTLMLSRRASATSLDDYIKNPQLAYDSYSGKLITAQAAQAASALSKEMIEKPRKWRSILGNTYYETMMQKGFSSDAVLQAIQDNPNAAPQLTKIIEDSVNSSGVRNWGDKATVARAIDYAKQGLWSAVGETQYQTLKNEAYLNPLQRAQLAKIKEENKPTFNPEILLGNPKSLARVNSTFNPKTLNMLTKQGYFNSKGQLTKKGWAEYNRVYQEQGKQSITGSGSLQNKVSSLKQVLDELNGGEISKNNKELTGQAAKAFTNAYRKALNYNDTKNSKNTMQSNYDMLVDTEYDVLFDNDSKAKDILLGSDRSTRLSTYKYGKNGYQRAEDINLHDSKFKNATFTGSYGAQGNFINITTTDGEHYKVPLAEAHPSLNRAVTQSIDAAKSLYRDSKGRAYTDEELNKYIWTGREWTTRQNEINKQLNAAYKNFGSSFSSVKSEPTKVQGGVY